MEDEKKYYGDQLRVKEVAEKKGMSLADVAEKMGVTYQSLSQSLKKNPNLKSIFNIAEVIGCSPRELFPGGEEVKSKTLTQQEITYDNMGNIIVKPKGLSAEYTISIKNILKAITK